jgi:bifunctional DNA-binding transcriptional regulator/antitoxin component of YhaV-PrlF toxin-antitoxin module
VHFTSYLSVVSEPDVLARLHQAGLLSESLRLEAVERVAELAIVTPDSGWVRDDAWKILLTAHERATLMERVRTELVYQLEYLLPEEREPGYDPVKTSLRGYKEAFESEGDHETARAFAEALRMYSSVGPSSAASSTNTSGPHKSRGQDRWSSSGTPHHTTPITSHTMNTMDGTQVKVSRNGQVSVPAAVRHRWGTSTVLIIDRGDYAIVRPVPDDPIEALRAAYAAPGPATDAARAADRAAEAASDDRRRGKAG